MLYTATKIEYIYNNTHIIVFCYIIECYQKQHIKIHFHIYSRNLISKLSTVSPSIPLMGIHGKTSTAFGLYFFRETICFCFLDILNNIPVPIFFCVMAVKKFRL